MLDASGVRIYFEPTPRGFNDAAILKAAREIGAAFFAEHETLRSEMHGGIPGDGFILRQSLEDQKDLIALLAGERDAPVHVDRVREVARYGELDLFIGTRPTVYAREIVRWLELQVSRRGEGGFVGLRQTLDPDVLPRLVEQWKMDARTKGSGIPAFHPYSIGEIMREDFLKEE